MIFLFDLFYCNLGVLFACTKYSKFISDSSTYDESASYLFVVVIRHFTLIFWIIFHGNTFNCCTVFPFFFCFSPAVLSQFVFVFCLFFLIFVFLFILDLFKGRTFLPVGISQVRVGLIFGGVKALGACSLPAIVNAANP